MPSSFLNITRHIIFLINIVFIIPFLAACLLPFLPNTNWWVLGFAGIIFPLTLTAIILFLLFWLFIKPLYSLVNIVVLLIGLQQIMAVFAFNKNEIFRTNKRLNHIRILTWNIQYIEGTANNGKERLQNREAALNYLSTQHADIICLQEYANHNIADTTQTNEQAIIQKTGLVYTYFPTRNASPHTHNFSVGSIIFSRYPIINSGFINYPNAADKLLFIDIANNKDTFRVYTTHLLSFKFGQKEYQAIETLKQQKDNSIDASKTLYHKMKLGFQGRAIQTNIVCNQLQKSPYPSIICGDFNDVPNSFTYFNIRQQKQDAFLQKGFGIGRTFRGLSPTLRIDYIFVDTTFKVHQFNIATNIKTSDHYPLVADIAYLH